MNLICLPHKYLFSYYSIIRVDSSAETSYLKNIQYHDRIFKGIFLNVKENFFSNQILFPLCASNWRCTGHIWQKSMILFDKYVWKHTCSVESLLWDRKKAFEKSFSVNNDKNVPINMKFATIFQWIHVRISKQNYLLCFIQFFVFSTHYIISVNLVWVFLTYFYFLKRIILVCVFVSCIWMV